VILKTITWHIKNVCRIPYCAGLVTWFGNAFLGSIALLRFAPPFSGLPRPSPVCPALQILNLPPLPRGLCQPDYNLPAWHPYRCIPIAKDRCTPYGVSHENSLADTWMPRNCYIDIGLKYGIKSPFPSWRSQIITRQKESWHEITHFPPFDANFPSSL